MTGESSEGKHEHGLEERGSLKLGDFSTEVYGKWILAGEHAVLRGCPALVFPVYSKSLKLRYLAGAQPLACVAVGAQKPELESLLDTVVSRAFDLIGDGTLHGFTQPGGVVGGLRREMLTGILEVQSDVPVGAGLGASATICVAVGRWFCANGWLEVSGLLEFARQLENLFHGESSGVDIAVAASGEGLHFERTGQQFQIFPKWKPKWYLSYTGQKGITSECVDKVKGLALRDSAIAIEIDEDMKRAVSMAERALEMGEREGFQELVSAVELAGTCFERWHLTEGCVGTHLRMLKEAGAAAVKPTGSGGGGFALSLWAKDPPAALRSDLIPLSR